jgi:hypothetical protein
VQHGPPLLFIDADLRDYLQEERARMAKEIADRPETELLASEISAWVAEIVERYALEVPAVDASAMSMVDEGERQVDVRYDGLTRAIHDYDRPALVAGRRVVVTVPFTGDARLFRLTPSTRTYNPPQAAVADGHLRFAFEYPHDHRPDIKGSVQHELTRIEQYLGWARGDVAAYNAHLEQDATQLITTRRERVLADRQHLDGFGIPVQRREDAPTTYAAAGIERRRAPATAARVAGSGATAGTLLAPVMVGELYAHILSLVESMGRAMERTPAVYRTHEEEQLRDQLLTMLNTRYQGQATGETFNAAGKTDILVRVDDRNVFIGECKWWGGPKAFAEAMQQLYGYSTWRDTKLRARQDLPLGRARRQAIRRYGKPFQGVLDRLKRRVQRAASRAAQAGRCATRTRRLRVATGPSVRLRWQADRCADDQSLLRDRHPDVLLRSRAAALSRVVQRRGGRDCDRFR